MQATQTALLLAGAGVVILATGKKKKRKRSVETEPVVVHPPGEDIDLDAIDDDEVGIDPGEVREPPMEEMAPPVSRADLLAKYMHPQGLARLGGLYQIRPGDVPLEVMSEALFGNRNPLVDPIMRKAAMDLLVRVDCSPYNQALYGVPLSELKEGHRNIDQYFTQRGVSYNPIYSDNYERILKGMKPTSERGGHFALIYIPMIDLNRLEFEGIVTTEGMNYPDTPEGIGYNMIDPPPDILALEFEEVTATQVGCELPEGDFRQTIVAAG